MKSIQGKTLLEIFKKAATQSDAKVHFWKSVHKIESFTYPQIFEEAKKIALSLQEKGIKKGDRVIIILPTHLDFYRAFFGSLLVGAIPCALYPPLRLGKINEWKYQTQEACKKIKASVVITNSQIYPLLGQPVSQAKPPKGCYTMSALMHPRQSKLKQVKVNPKDITLIQFSSGSTGESKAVSLTHQNILSNAYAFLDQLPPTHTKHSCVSWLPLYHDMGLIGCLISPMIAPGDVTLIPPEIFIGRPLSWLEALTQTKATVSVAPNFAYGLCTQKIKTSDLAGLDLSNWQVALCGAEPVQSNTLKKFAKKFLTCGLNPNVLTPVYGLAEASLALTFSDIQSPPCWTHFNQQAIEEQGLAIPDSQGIPLASLGKPVKGVKIEIRDADRKRLSQKQIGHVWAKGPNIMAGYWGDPKNSKKTLEASWLDTGDRGFLYQGNLYLCGRVKDLVIIRGRNYDPASLEATLDEIPQVRTGCSVALSHAEITSDTEQLILLVEHRLKGSKEEKIALAKKIQKKILENFGLTCKEILVLEPGTLPRTSSGKLRRFQAKQLWLKGELKAPPSSSFFTYLQEAALGYLSYFFQKST